MSKEFVLGLSPISLADIAEIIAENKSISLSDEAIAKIVKCRTYLEEKLTNSDQPFYGINTGFGSLCDTSIPKDKLIELQRNLVMSHACGVGEKISKEVAKLILLLKIRNLSLGYSGVRLHTIQRLIDLYNHDVIPVIYEHGSLGASGDLAPLAHLSLPLIGLGEVEYNDKIQSTEEVYKQLNWQPIELHAKEGLALLNGTQFMSAFFALNLIRIERLMNWADTVGTMSLEAFNGKLDPFYHGLHEIRNHSGQIITAKKILELLEGSEIATSEKKQVQDPYCFRCIPQVHGAIKDVLQNAKTVLENEMNAVTDNPTIFPDEDLILSGGNFHGEPLALQLDFLAISSAELGSISERRTYKLLSGQRGLPAFLIAEPGLNSGFMIPQYAAASLVSMNKQLATPSSVDSIDSSNGQEDHVSMGANSAIKLNRLVNNLEEIIAIELLTATQALDLKDEKSSPLLEKIKSDYRKVVPFVNTDRVLHFDIKASKKFITSHKT
jgi:histidine ammonia-lyase